MSRWLFEVISSVSARTLFVSGLNSINRNASASIFCSPREAKTGKGNVLSTVWKEKQTLRLEDKKIDKVEDKGVKQQAGREKDQPGDSLLTPLINQSQEERSGGKGFQSKRHKAGITQNRHLKNAAKVKIR